MYEVSVYLRRLSRRRTDAIRQEAHDYGLGLGSSAAAAEMRAVSPVVRHRAVPISNGPQHASTLIIGVATQHSSLFLRDKSSRARIADREETRGFIDRESQIEIIGQP